MSVINQMLKDLDKQQQAAPAPIDAQVKIGSERKLSPAVIALSVAIVAISAGAGFMFWQKQASTPADIAQQTIPAESVVIIAAPEQDDAKAVNTQPSEDNPSVSHSSSPKVVEVIDEEPLTVLTEKAPVEEPVRQVKSKAEKPIEVVHNVEENPISAMPTTDIVDVEIAPIPLNAAKVETPSSAQIEGKAVDSVEPQVIIKKIKRTSAQQAALYQSEAEDAYLSGDTEKAKLRFQQVLDIQAGNNTAREQLAAILFGEKRTQSAVNLLQQGLSVSPEYANFRLMLARIYMKNNDKKQAYYYLKPYQPDIVGHLDYYALLAGLAQNLADLDVAFEAYSKLTEVDPNRAKWWLGLGITADKLQRSAFALNAYQTAQAMGQLSAASRKYIDARIALLEK